MKEAWRSAQASIAGQRQKFSHLTRDVEQMHACIHFEETNILEKMKHSIPFMCFLCATCNRLSNCNRIFEHRTILLLAWKVESQM